MDVLATVKDDIYQPAVDSVMGIPSALKETFTTKKKATSVGWAMGGLVGASVIGAGLTMLPLGRLPFGNGIRVAITGGMGIAMMTVGSKD